MSDANYNHKADADALRDGSTAAVLSIVDMKGGASIPASWTSQEVDGAAAIGFKLNTAVDITTDLSKLLSIQNLNVEYLNVRNGTDWYGETDCSILEIGDATGAPALQFSMETGYNEILSVDGIGMAIETSSDWSLAPGYQSSGIQFGALAAGVSIWGIDDALSMGAGINIDNINGIEFVTGPVPGAHISSFGTDGRFKTVAAQYVHRQDSSLQMAIAAANSLRATLLAHAADGAEHFHGGAATPDTVNFAAMPAAATDLATLITLIAYMQGVSPDE